MTFDLNCPHCKKTFTARLIEGEAERYRGFKCPHCKLFVPASHGASHGEAVAGEDARAQPARPFA